MEVKVFEDCASSVKTTPFEIHINGRVYSGVFIETINSVGGMQLNAEYEIEWDEERPDINKEEVVEMILKEMYGMQ
ncbi:MAG: hypothetical protein QXG36_09300 [Nitrososphaeria archaeon]